MPNEKPIPQQIPIEKIHDLPGIPIVKLPDKSYGGLVTSMLLDGVKEPVILRQREDGEYQLVSGFRHRKAAELAKLKELPALVYDMTEKEAMAYCEKRNAENPPPIPGKLIDPAAKTPASAKEPPKAEKAAESKAAPAPAAKPEDKKPDAPADKKPEEKPAEKKAAEPPKPEAPKAAPAPEAKPVEKKADAPADKKPEEKPAEKKAAEPPKPETPKAAPASPAKPEEKKAAPAPAKAPAKKTEKAEEPVGTAAVGPTGTLITKLLGEKLAPPTEKDKKALPIPGEGEAFAVTLHPAYLKKAEINTFSVDRSSDDFKELFQSIKRFGVKDPVLARFGKDGELEIISGQRRHLIASELNYPVPTIIQQLDDDDARILVADGNLHREHISTYDLSRAVKMKSESMKRKVGRKSKYDNGPKKQYTDEAIAAEMGMSTAKLNRLMKLSEATKQICDLVDDNTIPLSVAYNIAFLTPKVQDTVADLIGINYKVNNENTQMLKKVAEKETLTTEKIKAVLDGKYPPKQVEKPKTVAPAVPATPTTPAMAPASVPKSPDVASAATQPSGNVVPFPAASTTPAQSATPASPSAPVQNVAPVTQAQAAPAAPSKVESGAQDRENSYETKIVLRGDRLRKYFPDVSMTPLAIENSIYDALEERRQRQEHAKQKAEIFGKEKKGPVK